MTASNSTRGQIERNLTQKLQELYQSQLGQRPGRVICQFFDEKIAIVLEDALTRPEQFLMATHQTDVAEKLRSGINDTLEPRIKALIEEVVGVPVVSILKDTALESKVSGMIVVLGGAPPVSNPESIPKLKREKVEESKNEQ